jgi:hypothetical protein
MGAQRLREDEQRRVDAFLQLTRVERALRTFLKGRLLKADGPRWVKALPPDVAEKAHSGGLEYTDFPDLKKIIGSAWRKLGAGDSGVSKTQITSHLEGLEPIRNDLAHSREISEEGLVLIQAAYFVTQKLTSEQEPAGLPQTDHPGVAIHRVRGAVGHCSSVDAADLAAIRGKESMREACEALEAYERVRCLPGRDPALLERVTREALARLPIGAGGDSK